MIGPEERISELEAEIKILTEQRDHARNIAALLAECSWITPKQREMLFAPMWRLATSGELDQVTFMRVANRILDEPK